MFDSADDSSCPTLPALTSYDYWNPSHASFPPDAVQPTPQLLTPPDPSYGYPALDPTLLAISFPQPQSSLPSKPTPPTPAIQVAVPIGDSPPCATVECHPNAGSSNTPSTPGESTPLSNITTVPGVITPSTLPDNSTPGSFDSGVSIVLPAGDKSTWAAQNLGWPIMQSRQPLSAVEKEHRRAHAASRQISAAQRKDRDMLLSEAIHSLADELEAKVQVIATTHNVTHEKVKKLLGGHKYYRNPRSTQLANAIIHDKAHKVNEGRARGDKLSLQQIRDLAKNASVHATNSAAVHDVQLTLEHVFKILDGLTLRTGLYVCLFATHGHVYDSSQPFWYGTDNVMDFWEDVMNVKPDELVCKLEQWACVQGKNIEERNSVEGMQRLCARILNSGLRAYSSTLFNRLSHTHTGIVAKKKNQINFINFEVAIKEKYGIDLLGWPEGVPFQSPCAITSAEHLWTLRDAFKAGSSAWNIKIDLRSGEVPGRWLGTLARSVPMWAGNDAIQDEADLAKRHWVNFSRYASSLLLTATRGADNNAIGAWEALEDNDD
ncbi:hypothetical protein BKA83DRAFT_4132479 [Pisolithus microcarpus]|nr:hypothetical protein BKA83DRAFT_4132479 [Pisolithus microcarpus]